jgi:predicted HicB family RNase H-like nuclease
MNTMNHKGYAAIIEFDADAGIFHGELVGLRDVVTFEGRSVEELQAALADSVDDYLDFCASRGEAPERPFSGRFVVRTEPDLHRAAAVAAKRDGVSLNKWVAKALQQALG